MRSEYETRDCKGLQQQQAWEQDKASLMQRVRELEARAVAAGDAQARADDGTAQRVMAAIGDGCSEATARRLLSACGNDSDKAVRLAQSALAALHKSWDMSVGPDISSINNTASASRTVGGSGVRLHVPRLSLDANSHGSSDDCSFLSARNLEGANALV